MARFGCTWKSQCAGKLKVTVDKLILVGRHRAFYDLVFGEALMLLGSDFSFDRIRHAGVGAMQLVSADGGDAESLEGLF